MAPSVDRRSFMRASASLAAGLGLGVGSVEALVQTGQAPATAPQAAPPTPAPPVSSLDFKTKLQKALIVRPADDLAPIKNAGFDGVEAREVPLEAAATMREAAGKIGLRIHAVLYGWAEFNSADKGEVERTFAESQAALRSAEALGADAVLLVPCRIGPRRAPGGAPAQAPAMRIPRPWEFQVEFDPKNGHLKRVVYGDNSPCADYIAAHNHATDASREWVQRLIPLAEKTKVVIALENVGNNLWVTPDTFTHFVRSFGSPWVKAYFDIANHHVRFSRPEEWILSLGDLLAKVHVKDYLLDPANPDGRGKFTNIREGSVRWPVVRQALESVNYSGWMTIEGSGDISMEERNRRLDLIVAGR
jgi:hexulose-6-phosphate isomerase